MARPRFCGRIEMNRITVALIALSLTAGWLEPGFSCAADAAAPKPAIDPKINQEFYDALFFKDVEKIKKLLADHPGLANAEFQYQVPLQRACSSGSLEVVRLLVAMGSDAKAVNSLGTGPLTEAAHS